MEKKILPLYTKKKYSLERKPVIVQSYAKQIVGRIDNDTDIIFSPSSIPIAKLEIEKPVVFHTDATFAGMMEYHKKFSSLCKETIGFGNLMEQAAIDRCDLAICSSDWAAETTIRFYSAPREKVKVIPFGANIENRNDTGDIENI